MNRYITVGVACAVLVAIVVAWRLGGPAATPGAQSAVERSCENVLSDAELVGVRYMDVDGVQAFLASRGSALAMMSFDVRPAAEIIVSAARRWVINPLVVLVTLQKEQGLVTSPSPSSAALDFAMGWGKPSSFVEQVEYGTRQFRLYLENPQRYAWRSGAAGVTLDGVRIVPTNAATAAMYSYTPWAGEECGGRAGIGGVGLFLKLWRQYLGR